MCGIERKRATIENVRPNLVERVRMTLVGMIRAIDFTVLENPLRDVDVLSPACAWELLSTVSEMSNDSLGDLNFNT